MRQISLGTAALATLLAITLLFMTACSTLGVTNWSPEKARIIGCSSYAGALTTLAGYRMAGKLSTEEVATVDQWRTVLNPICTAETAPTTTSLLDTLEQGVIALITLQKENS